VAARPAILAQPDLEMLRAVLASPAWQEALVLRVQPVRVGM
jgi:hypothetical protein